MTTHSGSTTAAPGSHEATGTGGGVSERTDTGTGTSPERPAEAPLMNAPLRRRPAQQRSMARVRKMLDACAELLEESGYNDLSTTRIAERAGVAIGSVYQFFPDKKAMVQALGLRYLDQFSGRVTDRLRQNTFGHWTEAVDVIIDEYLDMHRNVPGFRVLHFGDAVDAHLLDAGADNNKVIATRLRELLTSTAGVEDSEELNYAAMVAVEAADAVLKLAFRDAPKGTPA
nr:TetR/AcrR family transcriptional regulator [Allosalinactinospora lopnorensis]